MQAWSSANAPAAHSSRRTRSHRFVAGLNTNIHPVDGDVVGTQPAILVGSWHAAPPDGYPPVASAAVVLEVSPPVCHVVALELAEVFPPMLVGMPELIPSELAEVFPPMLVGIPELVPSELAEVLPPEAD